MNNFSFWWRKLWKSSKFQTKWIKLFSFLFCSLYFRWTAIELMFSRNYKYFTGTLKNCHIWFSDGLCSALIRKIQNLLESKMILAMTTCEKISELASWEMMMLQSKWKSKSFTNFFHFGTDNNFTIFQKNEELSQRSHQRFNLWN